MLRLRRLDMLTGQLEAPANAVEIKVWRELAGSCGKNREGRAIGDSRFFNRLGEAHNFRRTNSLEAVHAAMKMP